MRKAIITATFAMIAVGSIQAQEIWNLRRCIDYALENNLTVRRQANQAEQDKVEVNTAKYARLPNLNASASQNFSWGRTASPVDNSYKETNNSSANFGISTNIPLFTGLQLPNQYALTKLNLRATIEDLNKAKEDISINVTSAYLQVLYTQEIKKVTQEQIGLSMAQLQRVQHLSELGKASPAEVAEAKARVAQDELSAVQANNNYKLALLDLSQLLELPSPEGFSIESPDTELQLSTLTPPDEIYLSAVEIKPGIRAAQLRLAGSEKSIKIAQSGYYPQLSFGAGISSGYYTVSGIQSSSFSEQLNANQNKYIGFNLSIPLFNRFSTRNNVRTARLRRDAYSLQLEESKKGLYKEIQQAWYSALAAEAKYNTSGVAATANHEAFQLISQKYENGKANSIEFSEAKMNLLKSQSEQIQAKYEYLFRSKILKFYKGEAIE